MTDVKVVVTVNKGDSGIDVTVAPFVVTMYDDQELEWALESTTYGSATISIEEKSNGSWPFKNSPPKDVKKGEKKKSGETKDRYEPRTPYNILCSVVDGKTTSDFVIDPDIIIIRRSS